MFDNIAAILSTADMLQRRGVIDATIVNNVQVDMRRMFEDDIAHWMELFHGMLNVGIESGGSGNDEWGVDMDALRAAICDALRWPGHPPPSSVPFLRPSSAPSSAPSFAPSSAFTAATAALTALDAIAAADMEIEVADVSRDVGEHHPREASLLVRL